MFGLTGWIVILWTIGLLEVDPSEKNEDYHLWVWTAIIMHVMVIITSLFGLLTSRVAFVSLGEWITLIWFTPYTCWFLYCIWPDLTLEKKRVRCGWLSLVSRI